MRVKDTAGRRNGCSRVTYEGGACGMGQRRRWKGEEREANTETEKNGQWREMEAQLVIREEREQAGRHDGRVGHGRSNKQVYNRFHQWFSVSLELLKQEDINWNAPRAFATPPPLRHPKGKSTIWATDVRFRMVKLFVRMVFGCIQGENR